MSEDIELQIKQSFNDSSTKWAIQLDETTDISNKAQLLAFLRFVDTGKIVNNYFFCKELKQRTTGADIFELVDENVMKYNLRWENCVSVCTDGAPAMKGSRKGLIAHVIKKNPNIKFVHCMIHREMLVSKSVPPILVTTLDEVVKVVNYIKSNALRSRIFSTFCEAMESDYKNLLFHTEVRWLSKGKVLNRFISMKNEIMAFIDNEEINFPFMMSDVWWLRVSFLGDIFDKLNSLNLNLQGAQENIITISTKLKAFKEKLSLWNLNIAKENFASFPMVQENPSKSIIKKEVEETLTLLSASFDKYFPYLDVEKMEWELSEFWLCLNSKFPKLSNAAIESLLPFGSSYLCEQGFSTLTEMKSKKRERLQMIDEEMRVCLSQNSEADEELPNDDSEFYFGKDGVTKWKKTMWQKTQIRTRSVNIISQLPGPKSKAKSIESESDAFTKIIDNDMVQKIVDCTNAYISNIKEHFSRERDAKLTTVTEILALFGLLKMSGVKRAAHLTYKEQWAVDGSGVEIVRAIMSQDRFLFLLRCLRFDDITTRKERKKLDKLAPIREFVEAFVYNCKKLYTPGEYNTIDEKLIPFRGRILLGRLSEKYPTSSVLWTERTSWSIPQAASCGRKGRLGVSHKQSLVDGKDTERTLWTSHEPRQSGTKLSQRRCCTRDLNEKYQALLVVKEGITEESIDREWQECDKYEEEKFDIQQKVSVLRNPDKEETIPIASEDTVINVKLPELALKSYDGSLEGANYALAVQALQERFGDPNILTELYVRRLLNSVISNVKKENRNLSSLYDELSSHLRSLETLGIDPQLSGIFLYPLVESSLPSDILKIWHRHPSSGYGLELAKREESDIGVGGAQERLRLLLDFLKAEVRSAQRLKFVEKGFKQEEPYKRSYNDGTRTRSNFRPATVSSLFGGRTNIKCFFCERTNHASHQCRSIMKMSPGERNDKIRSAHLCFKCLRKGHLQSQCREQLECKNCGRNHLEVLCEGNSSNRLTKPGRENLKENAPEPIASLSSQACTGQVLLMTTVALLRGPNASRRVRILLDSGSQFSYIKQSLVWSIGIERKGEITIAKSLFGGNKIGEEKHGKFMLELENLGNKRDVIHIEALDQRKICDAIPPLPKGDWLEKLKIKGIILSQDNFKGQEIDILIGANYLGMILTGKIVQVEADLTAVETKLGWTLMGNSPIIDSNDNVQQTLNLLTTRCDLKDLWDLEKEITWNFRKADLKKFKEKLEELCNEDLNYRTLDKNLEKFSSNISKAAKASIPRGRRKDLFFPGKPPKKTTAVFLDMTSAFDRVWREKLLERLHNIRVIGKTLIIIEDFLRGRRLKVRVNGEFSKDRRTWAGVTQGSMLSPLLYLLYINDIHPYLTEDKKVACYSDDIAIWHTSSSIEKSEKILNTSMMWAMKLQMTINPIKPNLCVFSTEREKRHQYNHKISINNQISDKIRNSKYLGVILQSWIFPVDLEDHAITIPTAAKYAIYVFFVHRKLRGVAGDPLAILHQTLQRWQRRHIHCT
ncbi:hypothetical protein LAZ67_11002922 [Cordylochernes scorpioides]|uniref:Uncharacterized protein n=1 Tax=Cordylochernes scorpioides TaxID=51811 RepID=A0ABY6L1D3_9ARAC|nr:hypothetical protein LAZ67_11002922 [Cordylochernes scorpioides]